MSNSPQDRARDLMRTSWIISCSIGASGAIALGLSVYAAFDSAPSRASGLWTMVAGVLCGLCLGSMQSLALRRRGVVAWRWIAASVLGAALGTGLFLLARTGADGTVQQEGSLRLNALTGAVQGLNFGVFVGAMQWLGAGRLFPARRWVLANIAGWVPAMSIILIGVSAVKPVLPLPFIVLEGTIVGGIAGSVLGLVTSLALPIGRLR